MWYTTPVVHWTYCVLWAVSQAFSFFSLINLSEHGFVGCGAYYTWTSFLAAIVFTLCVTPWMWGSTAIFEFRLRFRYPMFYASRLCICFQTGSMRLGYPDSRSREIRLPKLCPILSLHDLCLAGTGALLATLLLMVLDFPDVNDRNHFADPGSYLQHTCPWLKISVKSRNFIFLSTGDLCVKPRSGQLFSKHCRTVFLHPLLWSSASVALSKIQCVDKKFFTKKVSDIGKIVSNSRCFNFDVSRRACSWGRAGSARNVVIKASAASHNCFYVWH